MDIKLMRILLLMFVFIPKLIFAEIINLECNSYSYKKISNEKVLDHRNISFGMELDTTETENYKAKLTSSNSQTTGCLNFYSTTPIDERILSTANLNNCFDQELKNAFFALERDGGDFYLEIIYKKTCDKCLIKREIKGICKKKKPTNVY